MLAQEQHAIRAAQRAHRGEIGQLSVGLVPAATVGILSEVLRVFRDRFPEVELSLHELTTSPQLQALHARRLDVGFLYLPFTDDTLRYEIIHREPLVAMLPQHHDLASREHIPLRMLTCEPFVLPPYTRAYGGRDQIMRICQKAGFMPHVVQEATQAITIASLVAASIGVSVVSMSSQTLRCGRGRLSSH